MLVTVMMSTYNGEKFLRKQLDSILAQELPSDTELKIIVRDDCSSDGTVAILEEYRDKYADKLSYYVGENIRPEHSFRHLTVNCPKSDYYAYSDQDDYWYPDKLARALQRIRSEEDGETPILYSSNVMVADAELNPVAPMRSETIYTDFAHVLIYNVSTGCTIVYNDKAQDEIVKYNMDENLVIMHDRLADLIVSMFGKIIYDMTPSMLYRQHGGNVCGEQSLGKFKSFVKRVKRFLGPSNSIRSDRARMLLDLYGDRLSEEKKQLLYALGYYKTDKRARKYLLKNKQFAVKGFKNFLFHSVVRFKKL